MHQCAALSPTIPLFPLKAHLTKDAGTPEILATADRIKAAVRQGEALVATLGYLPDLPEDLREVRRQVAQFDAVIAGLKFFVPSKRWRRAPEPCACSEAGPTLSQTDGTQGTGEDLLGSELTGR